MVDFLSGLCQVPDRLETLYFLTRVDFVSVDGFFSTFSSVLILTFLLFRAGGVCSTEAFGAT